eukprot:m.105869 g.105869  ORF g.105869 m.105869 type:complete len:280 (-) comp14212_c1_seq1:1096-1935(-)
MLPTPRLAEMQLDEDQHASVYEMPGLRARPVWDLPALTQALEAAHGVIRAEYEGLRASGLQGENVRQQVPKGRWNMFALMEEGRWRRAACAACPATVAVLRALPLPICTSTFGYVYFSEIGPGTIIAPHCGVTNTKLRVQLALIAPETRGQCVMRVAGECVEYAAGRAFVFDDSFVHGVENTSEATRVVLLADVWHPDLPHPPRTAVPWQQLGIPPFAPDDSDTEPLEEHEQEEMRLVEHERGAERREGAGHGIEGESLSVLWMRAAGLVMSLLSFVLK